MTADVVEEVLIPEETCDVKNLTDPCLCVSGAGSGYDSHVRDHPGSLWLDSGSLGGLQEVERKKTMKILPPFISSEYMTFQCNKHVHNMETWMQFVFVVT